MKKLVFSSSFTMLAAIILAQSTQLTLYRDSRGRLNGDGDYDVHQTGISQLVKFCDMGGFGQVIGRGNLPNLGKDYLTIRIETALWGCTNGQYILIEDWEPRQAEILPEHMEGDPASDIPIFHDVFPTNQASIVFAASTNKIYMFPNYWRWDAQIPKTPSHTYPLFELSETTRSWWEPDYEGGWQTLYFTNVVRTLRTQRNWTNYYEVCRDALAYPSVRVNEDVIWDLHKIIQYATQGEMMYMRDDPLLPQFWRDYLNRRLIQKQTP